MSKVLVEITIPAIGKSYDLYLPKIAKISEVIKIMSDMLSETDASFYSPTEDAVICEKKTGEIYHWDMSVGEAAIYDGKKLMLI